MNITIKDKEVTKAEAVKFLDETYKTNGAGMLLERMADAMKLMNNDPLVQVEWPDGMRIEC